MSTITPGNAAGGIAATADAWHRASTRVAPRRGLMARLPFGMVIIGVLVVALALFMPVHSWLLDALLGLNITIGLLLLVMALQIRSALDFSVFPSVLLISAMLRCAGSVANTRAILAEAHAGKIIDAFGSLVAAGNLVVGLIVYLVIAVFQFLVVSKGAERVAEVSARFTLDSMPGKQLSIDSDLRSGLIDKDEARRRRRVLEAESKLHGSLDGAMKFIKNETIFGLVCVVLSLIGGLAIGVLQKDMTMGDAMRAYSILSIGEGLGAQIPALFAAWAAGMLVTRTDDGGDSQGKGDGHGDLGQIVAAQFSAHPRVLLATGGIALAMAAMPKFPGTTFALLGTGLMLAGAVLTPALRARLTGLVAPAMPATKAIAGPRALAAAPAEPRAVLPLLVDVRLAEAPPADLEARLAAMLDAMQHRIGLPLPRLAVHVDRHDGPPGWVLLAWESPLAAGALAGPDAAGALVAAVQGVLRRHVGLFIGLQETTALLNRLGLDYPEVVKEAVRTVPTSRIADVLRRLAEEDVPLRALRDVMEGIADAGAIERDGPRIADRVRIHLKRHILAAVAPGGTLRAAVASPELEDRIRQAVRVVDGAEHLALAPDEARRIVDAIAAAGADALIASFDVRRPLRQLIAPDLFDLPVLAYNELTTAIRLDIIGQVTVPQPALAAPAEAAE